VRQKGGREKILLWRGAEPKFPHLVPTPVSYFLPFCLYKQVKGCSRKGGKGKAQNRKRKFREREQEECIRDDNARETERSLPSPSSTESVNSSDESQLAI
jgi:hypothetical protein